MADDVVQIPGAAGPQGPPVNIRTFVVQDALGRLVEVQGVTVVDEAGRPTYAATEVTLVRVANALEAIANLLADAQCVPRPY